MTKPAEIDAETAIDDAPGKPWRTAFHYFGGKTAVADWIIGHFPPHTLYVEPFGGAASVLLRKSPSRHEVYNDLNGDVVNFFRVLRNPETETALIRALELTPYSRAEHRLAFDQERPADPVEAARRFLIKAEMSINKNPTSRTCRGFDVRDEIKGGRLRTSPGVWRDAVANLSAVAKRLAGVVLENGDALAVIKRYDRSDALFYCDPPYVASTRTGTKGEYHGFDMTDEGHVALAAVLKDISGEAIVSGYRSPLYDELYGDWRRYDRPAIGQKAARRIESIWLSPGIRPRASLF